MTLSEYVREHTNRGECRCGKCIDAGNKPDPDDIHTVDLMFFKVTVEGQPTTDEFIQLSKAHKGEFGEVDVFDGEDHGYMELGGWIGDQGIAMQYMGLGAILGVFDLKTPASMLPMLEKEQQMELAGRGMVTVSSAMIRA